MCDQTISLTGQCSQTDYPEQLRRIRFKDETGKVLVFLTNNMALPAATIAALYIRVAGRSNCSLNGSSSTWIFSISWARVRTLCASKSGAPSPPMCLLLLLKKKFMPRFLSTLFYRFFRSLLSRESPFHAPCSAMSLRLQFNTQLTS